MALYPKIQDLPVKGARVFLRVDFNVPLKPIGDSLEVANSARIEAALETIRYIQEQEGRVILGSHLGRPKGKRVEEYSLEPVGKKLSELLETEVKLSEECVGDGPKALSQNLRPGEILLLENLRFHPGEESNDPGFSNKLADLCDVYVNEAFGTLHRAHASTAGISEFVRDSGVGFLVQKELSYLEPLRDNPKQPFVLIMGGAKVSDKLALIEHFLPKVKSILIGGAMAYAFLKAQGYEIGKSLCSDDQVTLAGKLLKTARAHEVSIVLPVDHVVADSLEDTSTLITEDQMVPLDKMALDIGPKTVELFARPISQAETLFWNGPMGVFEKKHLAEGTFGLAKVVTDSSALKLAGGGDVAAAVSASGLESKFDFISTGGGATLEFLEGRSLPGLKALETAEKEEIE